MQKNNFRNYLLVAGWKPHPPNLTCPKGVSHWEGVIFRPPPNKKVESKIAEVIF